MVAQLRPSPNQNGQSGLKLLHLQRMKVKFKILKLDNRGIIFIYFTGRVERKNHPQLNSTITLARNAENRLLSRTINLKHNLLPTKSN